MKITIAAVGSRGDIQPYIALGAGLRKAGHDVALSAPSMFAGLIREHGLSHRPVSVNPKEIMEAPEMKAAMESNNPLRLVRVMLKEGGPLIRRYLREVSAHCADADAVVGTMICYGSFDAARARGIPYIQTLLGPTLPTAAFPSVALSTPRIPSAAWNRFTHHLIDQALWQSFRATHNAWRASDLGLPPLPFFGPFAVIRRTALHLLGYSELILPTPPDWPSAVRVTGYWFLDPPEGWSPPRDVCAFLEAGPQPVYIGFGSMPEKPLSRLTQMVADAVTRLGIRCVLSSGHSGSGGEPLPESVFRIDTIPHGWLLPRMAAVVHHGGAGTTAAAFRAGVPQAAIPFAGDQPFWADRVNALGAGPIAIPRKRLTTESLCEILHAVTVAAGFREKAADLGTRIRAEDGVAKAVADIGSFLGSRP